MTNVNGLTVIGYFCWWSLNNVKVAYESLKGLLSHVGIEHDMPEPKMRSAFLKAVQDVKGEYERKGLLIRKIKKAQPEYVFGLVDETISKASQHLSYYHAATMRFNSETGTFSCDNPHRAFDLIKAAYDIHMDSLDADDVREVVLAILHKIRSVSVRQRGGIYFVPEVHKDTVEKLEQLFKLIPGDNYFAVAPQIDTEKSKNAIYKAFMESLKGRIADFEKDLDDDTGVSRSASLKSRLEEFKEMRKEIEFYHDALQFQAEDISKSLENLTEKVKSKLLAA